MSYIRGRATTIKFKKLLSVILAAAIAASLYLSALASETQSVLPTPAQISGMSKLSFLEQSNATEADVQAALDAIADEDFAGKLLALAQIAQYVEVNNASPEMLIGFLEYIGEDLQNGFTASLAADILENPQYSDTFKIYIIDIISSTANSTAALDLVMQGIAADTSESEDLRILAAHNIEKGIML